MAEQRFVPAMKHTPQAAVALTVSGGATPSNTSVGIDVSLAKTIGLQVQNGASTSLNVYVYASCDGVIYDDQSYASMNLGANQEKTLLVSPGPEYIRVTVTNADAVNTTTVTSKLIVRS